MYKQKPLTQDECLQDDLLCEYTIPNPSSEQSIITRKRKVVCGEYKRLSKQPTCKFSSHP